MKRHVVWVGISAGEVLCGNERARDTVEQVRNNGRIITLPHTDNVLRLQAFRADGVLLGFGCLMSVTPRGGTIEMPSSGMAAFTAKVERALKLLGVRGPISVRAQAVDMAGAAA